MPRPSAAATLIACLLLLTGCRPHNATRSAPPPAQVATAPAAPGAGPVSQPSSRPAARAGAASDPFESDIRAFEQADAANPPPPDGVVFVGSSSIRLWKTLREDFPGLTVLNRGFGGSQVADSVRYADRIVLPYRPRAIVLYAGDNDIAAGKSPEQVRADFDSFVTKVRAALPESPVLYLAIKPSVARWNLVEKIRTANRLIARSADESGGNVIYVDVFSPMLDAKGEPRPDLLVADGLHMNRAGYELWTSVLRPHLDRALAATGR